MRKICSKFTLPESVHNVSEVDININDQFKVIILPGSTAIINISLKTSYINVDL